MWKGKSPNARNVIVGTSSFLTSWEKANEQSPGESDQVVQKAGQVKWTKPESGWTKLNVDVAKFEGSGVISVFCGTSGEVLLEDI